MELGLGRVPPSQCSSCGRPGKHTDRRSTGASVDDADKPQMPTGEV